MHDRIVLVPNVITIQWRRRRPSMQHEICLMTMTYRTAHTATYLAGSHRRLHVYMQPLFRHEASIDHLALAAIAMRSELVQFSCTLRTYYVVVRVIVSLHVRAMLTSKAYLVDHNHDMHALGTWNMASIAYHDA